MKKIYSLMIVLLIVGSSFAQIKKVTVTKTATAPEMDGVIEDVWTAAPTQAMDRTLLAEVPSVGASTWQALYDDDNFYVVVNALDDNHYPAWASGGNAWEYDKPEIYWDVNPVLVTDPGVGPATASSGHYQLSPGFLEDGYDVAHTDAATTQSPGGTYAYSLVGEGYVYEMAVPWANFKDLDGNVLDVATAESRLIGFDVCIIDQDKDVTTARQRAMWCQDGKQGVADEAWNNMNDAGQMTIKGDGIQSMKNSTVSVYPNPATNFVTISADFNRVTISNILGQQIRNTSVKSTTINVSDLSKGVYVIKAFKNDKYVGTAKVTKN
jgi:hypothetical protein